MELRSARLIFREMDLGYSSEVFDLLKLPEVDEFNTMGVVNDEEETLKHIHRWLTAMHKEPAESFVFVLHLHETQEFAGLFGITIGRAKYQSAELWYKLHPAFWNKGLATEATKRILVFCFENLALHRVEAGCAVENIGSVRVLEKCGFTREGQSRKKLPIRGNWADNYSYSILEEEFIKQAK